MNLLITTPVFPPELGGPSTYVPNLAKYLHERGHSVKVLTFLDDASQVKEYAYQVIPVQRIFLPLRYLIFFIKALIYGRDCNLFYVCEHISVVSFIAAKIMRKSVVLRIMVDPAWEIAFRFRLMQDSPEIFQHKTYGAIIGVLRKVQEYIFRRVDAVIAVGEYMATISERIGVPKEKIHICRNMSFIGDTDVDKEQARDELHIPRDKKVLLSVARLVNWKGVDGIINAMARLPSEYLCYIVGDGPHQLFLERLIEEKRLQERVFLVGRVKHEKIPLYMRAADCLILNSIYEGLSHVLLESMAAGLPIICSNAEGNKEIIKDRKTGLLIEYNNVDHIETAINTLMNDETLRKNIVVDAQNAIKEMRKKNIYQDIETILCNVGCAKKKL